MSETTFNPEFHKNIEESYPLLISMAETMHEMVMLLDDDRRLVYFNRRFKIFADQHNLSADYGSRPGNAFKCVNLSLGKEICGETSFCRYCGATKAIEKALCGESGMEDCSLVSENGNAYDLRISTSSIRLFDKRFTLYCVMDISSENRKNALEKIFFHDINNLSSGLGLITDVISTYAEENDIDSLKETLPLLTSAVTNMNNEIKSNYMLSLAEKDELDISLKEMDAGDIIRNVASFFKETTIDKNIIFKTVIPESDTLCVTDENIIKRIIINMTKNAVEASEDGETVTIGFKRDNGADIFYVKNPKVISDEVRMSIFKRSFSTKGIGRGLGTYSMRLLTERYLKGKVYFTSGEGKGTVFYAEIPANL